MSNTTEDSTNIHTPADDLESGPSHLAAAKSFFEDAPPAADEPIVAAPVVKAAPGILDKIVKAAPAPAAPAADAPAAEDIDKGLIAPPDNAKSRAGWDELKKRANAERDRASAAEKKAAELEARVKSAAPAVDEATRARLTELETQNTKFSDRLKVLDLGSHPEFVQKFVAPKNEAKNALLEVLKGDEVDADLDEILSLKGKALNHAISNTLDSLTPYARVKFQSALDRYITADLGAAQALAQADTFLKSAQQNSGARSREAFDRVSGNYRGQYIPIITDGTSDAATVAHAAEYNAALEQVSKNAESFAFGQLDEVKAADLAHKAALYDFTISRGIPRIGQLFEAELVARHAEIATLTAQVKALSAAKPTVSGGSGSGAADAPPADETNLDAARRFWPAK